MTSEEARMHRLMGELRAYAGRVDRQYHDFYRAMHMYAMLDKSWLHIAALNENRVPIAEFRRLLQVLEAQVESEREAIREAERLS